MPGAKPFYHRRPHCRLWVVPYVRGRLIFAETAVKAMQKGSFDALLLDFPSFMSHDSWIDAPLAAFPLVSSFLIQEDENACALFPFVPTDAACAAAWLARKRSMTFECVDPVTYMDGSRYDIPVIPICEDERLASEAGLRSYFETAWRRLDLQQEKKPNSSIKNLLRKGKAVAGRIYDRISSGAKVLFVCEYRLWWAVDAALKTENAHRGRAFKNRSRQTTRSCALLLEDPYFMWASGLFDDYLAVNKRFHESLQSEGVASFSKYRTLYELVGDLPGIQELSNTPDNPGKNLTLLVRKIKEDAVAEATPGHEPSRLFEYVRARTGAETSESLLKALLDYPMPTVSDTAKSPPQYFKIHEDKIVAGKKGFSLPDVFHANSYAVTENSGSQTDKNSARTEKSCPASWLCNVHPVLTRQEAREIGRNYSDQRWAVKSDYLLHAHASRIARQAVLKTHNAALKDEAIGVFTPITFIFDNGREKTHKRTAISDSNPTKRQMDLGSVDRARRRLLRPDSVYSLFATIKATDIVLEDHIEREQITSLTLLFSGSGMGLERYAAITQQQKDYQCRIRPEDDSELEAFECLDLGLAWALKYAGKHAIAVAYTGWKPSPDVVEFARRRQKQLLSLSLDVLPTHLIDRIQRLHFISTPLKLHPEGEQIVTRFIG